MQAVWTAPQPTGQFSVHTFAFPPDSRIPQLLRKEGGERGLTDLKFSARHVRGGKAVFSFNFGALAFWGYSLEDARIEAQRILDAAGVKVAISTLKDEDFMVDVSAENEAHVDFNRIVLDRLTLERAELISLTVAQSAAMELYESMVEQIRNEVASMVSQLARLGRVGYGAKKLQRTIGHVILIRNDTVGVLHMLDKPDLCWEDKAMDALYEDFRAVFDLEERYLALQYKLTSIQDTLEILLETFRARRSFVVEVLILVFIILEIVIASKSFLFAILDKF